MDLQLDTRTALITGASAGIGRGIALALGAEGARIAIVARRAQLLEELAAEVVARGGQRPLPIVCDLMRDDAAETIAERARDALGQVDIIVNCAGGTRPFPLGASEDRWDEALTLNFTRHRQLTERLVRPMMTRGWGRVVNITGKSEVQGLNGAACAKAAMHAWAKGLSLEVAAHGVTVNSIQPGRIDSEQNRRLHTEERLRAIPLGEYGTPADIADLVCFLASPRARYITGAVIAVDGGFRRYAF